MGNLVTGFFQNWGGGEWRGRRSAAEPGLWATQGQLAIVGHPLESWKLLSMLGSCYSAECGRTMCFQP